MNNNQKLSSYEKLDLATHVAMFLTIMGMVLWFHSESRQDWKHMDSKIEEIRELARQDYRHLEAALNGALQGIREEMKDFHGRLCAIEERNKGK